MERPRKLNPEIVEKSWNEVQKNKIYFQGLFGNENFMMVDNSNTLSPKHPKRNLICWSRKVLENLSVNL